ncbi:8-oxo-dGDP phosphatase NUDT18 isoform X1 [Gadus morhua]|uniref:Nudix hydrolase domain-containing protein n=2 Tax=Gadus morhua TaxID=8049 RepID=A0A8C5F3F4_GADMO|nr:8-oxo-dGDP phosphatase NUDT18 isoform X1 [Gadus morhua]XP_030215245.1 8-oxo-dGDP phosphatase NUDT18 isoform X1 [Gadus morhua]
MEVEDQIRRIMEGEGLEFTELDVHPDQAKPATLRKTVSYIVCAVILNDQEEVLMVQEAKQECFGQWYLPAGRMEEGEAIEAAMQREVKEEAGFDCQPITLLLIQEQGPQWIRFIFLAKVTGGSLKIPGEGDQESLQATWWDRVSPLQLRGRDILDLIDSGLKYHQETWHPRTLPVAIPCSHVVQRLVLIFSNAEEELWVLLVKAPRLHLPTAGAVKTHTLMWASSLVVQDALGSLYYDQEVTALGVLGLQHHYHPTPGRLQSRCSDGVCFNMLAQLVPDPVQRDRDGEKLEVVPPSQPPPPENPRYTWKRIQSQVLTDILLGKMKNPCTLPIHSLY